MSFTWSSILSILIGFLGIGIMILVHEFGHAFAARACGITVEALSFGFGPAIFKRTRGETQFIIRAIPFGGSCKMSGGDDIQNAITQKKKHIESYEDGSIWSVGPVKRIIAYAAGPLANIIFAFLCYAILMTMPTIVSVNPARVALSSDYPSLVQNYSTAAYDAGIRTGDSILSIEGIAVSNYSEMQQALAQVKDRESVSIVTDRGSFTVHPENGVFGFLPFQETVVGHVVSDSPEKKAGLKVRDRIISANGKPVTNMMDLLVASSESERITFEVLRDG
ncbi:MAG: RIP metalloprotease RseP, partial [Spirochaetales bacterium]|nr:RIP metalloprotease RseP [Spirochaetales bacterium]